MKLKLTPKTLDGFVTRPGGLSPDARALMSNIKPEGKITREYLKTIADRFQEEWGEERAVAAFTEVVERIESVAGDVEKLHGSGPGLTKDESIMPATEGDRVFRRSLRKGQQVAIVSRRPLEDGRIRVLVTHEKVAAIKSGFIRARTKIDGQGARMDIGILLVYSLNKFPTELKRTFADEGEMNDWFSGLEAKEEDAMMAADKTTDLRSWRNDARRGTRCEVHVMTSGGQRISKGKILEPAKKGARLQMEEGNICFKHWNEIYPDGWLALQPEPPKPKTLGKLGDVIDFQAVAKLPPTSQPGKAAYTVVPENKPEPPPPRMPVLPPKPAPEPLKLAPSRAKAPEESLRPGRQKGRGKSVPHAPTAIGNVFRSERLKRAWSQKQIAAHIDIGAHTVSDIELGDSMPDDDVLLRFSERFAVSLDLLLSARDGKQDTAADPVSAMHRIAELEKLLQAASAAQLASQEKSGESMRLLQQERSEHTETKAGLRAAEELIEELNAKLDKATMPWDAQALQAVNEFISRLTSVSPVPHEPEKRHAWYEAALKMFGAGK